MAMKRIVYGAIENIVNNGDNADLLYRYIEKLYDGRQYHDIDHIDQVLLGSDILMKLLKMSDDYRIIDHSYDHRDSRGYNVYNSDITTFVIAVLFHDAEIKYDEMDIFHSIAIAESAVKWFGLEEKVNFSLFNYLINCTDHPVDVMKIKTTFNLTSEQLLLGKIIHDADLLILSKKPFLEYLNYVGGVYTEVHAINNIPKQQFVSIRTEFLKKMLNSPIFSLGDFLKVNDKMIFEEQAKSNIEREISMHEAGISITF